VRNGSVLGRFSSGELNRRRLLGAAAAMAGTTLAACGRSGPGPQGGASPAAGGAQASKPRSGGIYNSYSQYNAPLDAHHVSAATTQTLASGTMSRLFRFKTSADPNLIADHTVESDLAISAESPDAVSWTVKLGPNARFQNVPPLNGRPVDPGDVKATLNRFLTDPQNPNRSALSMIDPAQIESPSTDTLVFKLKYPYAPFQRLLASGAYGWIFPREATNGGYDPAKQMLGSGPFMLDSYAPDVAYVFKKNPDWFESGRPYLDGIRYAIIPDDAQRLAQFAAGNLADLDFEIPDLDAIKRDNPRASIIKKPPSNSNSIYLQLGDQSSPFVDIRIRRAFSMALDRDAIGKVTFSGQSRVMVFVPLTLGKWSVAVEELDPSTAQYFKYNLPEAKKLLDAAGATNLSIKFAYIANGPFSSPAYRGLFETVGHMLSDLGVKITLIDHDYNKDFVGGGHGSRQGYFDKDVIVFGGIAQYTEADEYLYSYFHSKSASNSEHLNDPALDGMIDKGRGIVNEDERLKAYRDAQKYIADKMYVIPTCGGVSYAAAQAWVSNYNFGSMSGRFAETYSKLWLDK